MEPGPVAENELVLTGPLSREEIEAALPDWVVEQMSVEPDVAAAEVLAAALPGAQVTVYLGTWCSDSRRELSRLWRALDELGLESPDEIRYIGVDRDKSEPAGWIGDVELVLVPTFIVRRDGEELGRVVEVAPNGIEHDLAALLSGASEGVISGSEQPEPAANEN